MSNLTYEQIKSLTEWNEEETKHFMPNEIFNDLQTNIKKSPHVSFAYSYYYLTSWLYRYAKYGSKNIKTSTVKQLLGYSPTNKTINYIIKDKGVLDLMGYTESTTDYPILWHLNEIIGEHKELEFTLVNELDAETKERIRRSMGTNYKVKYPIRHFYRYEEDIGDRYLSGVFYDVSNTHEIGFDVFVHCMSIKELGTNGFYLYGYLKMKNQHFNNGYDVSLADLSEETGIPYKSMNRYLDSLRKYNLVKGVHNQEYFSINLEDKKANSYITNDSDSFTFKPQSYQKIEIKTVDEHLKIKDKGESEKADIKISELPY